MIEIASLEIADPPALWGEVGFTVEGDVCVVGSVAIHLGGTGAGITSWALREVGDHLRLDGADLDGLPTTTATEVAAGPPHANGVRVIDHLVVSTPDLDRTVLALEHAGLSLRRRRETERVVQCFFRMGDVILEVVGGPPGAPARPGPARFFGLAFTADDLAQTARVIGPALHAPKDAVQRGRQIATLDRTAGSSVPLAFMSPEPPRASDEVDVDELEPGPA